MPSCTRKLVLIALLTLTLAACSTPRVVPKIAQERDRHEVVYESRRDTDRADWDQAEYEEKEDSAAKRAPRNLLDEDDWSVLPDSAVLWRDAKSLVGQRALVCGRVASTARASESRGSPTFLDLGRSYPNTDRVSVVIWEEDLWSFLDDPLNLRGEFICVESEPYWYDGVVQMELISPEQVLIRES